MRPAKHLGESPNSHPLESGSLARPFDVPSVRVWEVCFSYPDRAPIPEKRRPQVRSADSPFPHQADDPSRGVGASAWRHPPYLKHLLAVNDAIICLVAEEVQAPLAPATAAASAAAVLPPPRRPGEWEWGWCDHPRACQAPYPAASP
jgi:hypothetical protein